MTTRRKSQTIYYSLASDRVTRLIDLLYELYYAPDCGVKRRAISEERERLTIDRAVMAFAGTVIFVSVALAQLHSAYWLLLTAFVGLNLLQASMTGFCRWLCSSGSG